MTELLLRLITVTFPVPADGVLFDRPDEREDAEAGGVPDQTVNPKPKSFGDPLEIRTRFPAGKLLCGMTVTLPFASTSNATGNDQRFPSRSIVVFAGSGSLVHPVFASTNIDPALSGRLAFDEFLELGGGLLELDELLLMRSSSSLTKSSKKPWPCAAGR